MSADVRTALLVSAAVLMLAGCSQPPQKTADAPEDAVVTPIAPGTPLKLTWTSTGEPAQPLIDITTNLPELTQIIATVSKGAHVFVGRDSGTVHNGRVRLGPFGPFLPGQYALAITTPEVDAQPEDVQDAVGPDYKNLTGEYFHDGLLGRSVNREDVLTVGRNPGPVVK